MCQLKTVGASGDSNANAACCTWDRPLDAMQGDAPGPTHSGGCQTFGKDPAFKVALIG